MKSVTQHVRAGRLRKSLPGKVPALIAMLGFAAPLGGCGVDRVATTGSIVNDDYRENHPIVLATQPETLDVFTVQSGTGLTAPTVGRVHEFAAKHVKTGQSQISVLLPRGGTYDGQSQHALDGIRKELLAGGARGNIAVGSYPVANPALAAPVRLSFDTLKAKVASTCGQWPADLASGSSLEGWNNRPYWNYGCATQSILAAQVDDPRDLASPRAETPPDTNMRTRGIMAVRLGKDPGTEWRTKNSTISQVGSN